MAEKSAFWTTSGTGDGPAGLYAQDRMQDVMRTLSATDPTLYYVAPARQNELAVTGSSSPVAINTGEAFVNGRHYLNDASLNITIPTPTTSTRIDRIILRSDGTAQTVRAVRLAGTEGSGSPPTLTQNSTTYEVSLYRVSITTGGVITLTDERGYFGLRGLVDAVTVEWDTTNKKLRVKDGGITAAKLASDAVTTVKILDANVTTVKILDANVTTAKLADGSVTTVKIADANIGTTKLADGSVSTAKLADTNVTTAKLADGSVTTVKIADANIGTTKLADGSVATAKIADANVTTAKLADNSVTTAKIVDANVTTAKLADNSVTTAKIADLNIGSTKLADGSVATAKIVDANVTTAKITDGAVTLAKLADNSVDDTKAGDRVPQFYRRQGGSATDWNMPGITTYTPTAVRMQVGVIDVVFVSGSATTSGTFPQAFSAKPVVILTSQTGTIQSLIYDVIATTSGFTIKGYHAATFSGTIAVAWLAVGPE